MSRLGPAAHPRDLLSVGENVRGDAQVLALSIPHVLSNVPCVF